MRKHYYIILGLILVCSLILTFSQRTSGESFAADGASGKAVITKASETSDIMLGQNFVVGIPGSTLDEATKTFLMHVLPGGIVLYGRNYNSLKQTSDLIAELQKFALLTTGHKYLIMLDEEPGGATRLGLFHNVFANGEPNWEKITSDIKTMHNLGINVDLAPVSDFAFNKNSFITFRMPANSPDILKKFNKQFIDALHAAGIAATLKHFPGLGIFTIDPHAELPVGSIDDAVLKQSLDIFAEGIQNGADLVMTAHAVYKNIDSNDSATLSSTIIQKTLRGELGFKGLTITDDLSDMPFIFDKKMDLTEAAINALMAGQNLLIFSHRNENTVKIYDAILLRMGTDASLQKVIEGNFRDIITMKDGSVFQQ